MRISDWSSDGCSSDLERPSETVLITVKGDSMIDAGIVPGDVVIVEKRQVARIGDIVVAIVDNEFTFKTMRRGNSPFVLLPDRQSVVEGKSVSVRVDLSGRRLIKKKRNLISEYN